MAVERPYKVRKTWEDTKSQLASYAILDKAIAKAEENPGYSVFYKGECLYTPMVHSDDILNVTVSDICHGCTDECSECTIDDHDTVDNSEIIETHKSGFMGWLKKLLGKH